MPRSLDDLRSEHPGLGFALYAIEPGSAVTLEVFADDQVFSFAGPTKTAVIDLAFPVLPDPPPANIFD